MMDTAFASRARIADVERLIRPHIRRTPVLESEGADFGLDGVTLVFKLELCQHAGAFKTRGAFANMLLRKPGKAGVTAASGGNHGAAVAYVAKKLGMPARIFIPKTSSPAKIARIRSYGAELVLGGERYQDSVADSDAYADETGALNFHAYDAEETILGAASVALEFEEQAPGLDAVLVAVGGGGLIAGICAWYDGRARVVGAEPELSPCLNRALAAGERVDSPSGGVAADSLGASRVGALPFAIVKDRLHDSVLVSDDAIVAAQKALWTTIQIVAEPGAATALAALLSGAYKPGKGERVGVILSGGNTTAVNFNV